MNKEKSAIYKLVQYSKDMMDFVFKIGRDRREKIDDVGRWYIAGFSAALMARDTDIISQEEYEEIKEELLQYKECVLSQDKDIIIL